jgi:predicted RNase H-like nuclease
MVLAGIDLAWRSNNSETAVALGVLEEQELAVRNVFVDRYSTASLLERLGRFPSLRGIAIDAPLIIRNDTGQRRCESLLGSAYGSRKASCHTSNLGLYPRAFSSELSECLVRRGFQHLGSPPDRWQIECYPHPALIEIFDLSERHPYKKGRVADRWRGQCALGDYLAKLETSPVLRLKIPGDCRHHVQTAYIAGLRGAGLKRNEDVLDSIVCLYIAGLYALGVVGKIFGAPSEGYIYVPQQPCT